MPAFISGLLTMGYATAALFFFRFYRSSRDRLFAMFGVAFVLLVIQRALLTFAPRDTGFEIALLLTRLLAYLVILIAIVDKNRRD